MTVLSYEEIVENFDSPTLVLAGPGAGKTYLLSDRVMRLLSKGVNNDEITVVTFGKAASLNMRNELLDPAGNWTLPTNSMPKIATLNSLGFEIVNESPRTVGLRKAGLAVQPNESVKDLLFRDSAYCCGYNKDIGISAKTCKVAGDCQPEDECLECAVCKKYWEIMSKCDRIDFDDQVLFACRILESKQVILQKYQEKSKHLLVDEYQDINAAQDRLIELLSRDHRKGLFVVGDDAQSIYGFRGANPKFILEFTKCYPEAIDPPLLHSRRCHENILRKSEKVLTQHYENWTGPFDLEFHPEIDDAPFVWQMPSEKAEAKMVTIIAKKSITENLSVLILAPKKEMFIEITRNLFKAGIPHVCPISLLPIHAKRRLSALHNVTKWVKNPNSNFDTRLAIEAIINGGICRVSGYKMRKGMKPETIEKREKVESELALLWAEVSRRKSLFEVLCEAETLCKELVEVRKLMIELVSKYEKTSVKEQGEFLKLASLATGSWTKPEHFVGDIDRISRLLMDKEVAANDNVKLMTMRKAKGLQADVVIMIGIEDDIIPNVRSDEEEEARLFYVSMTRAKKRLYMFHAFKRPRSISFGEDLIDKKRSRFLDAVGIDSEYRRMKS